MSQRKSSSLLAHTPEAAPLLADLRELIEEARRSVAVAVNASLTLMYWRIGRRIRSEVLGDERVGYGEEILPTLSAELVSRYGRGFSARNLWRMVQFAEAFPDEQIVATLLRKMSWSHFQELLPLKQPLQREFYAEMCRIEGRSVRTLRERIDSMLYERTALSKKPDELLRQELDILRRSGDLAPALVLKDPYVLDFLGLNDRYVERDLEDAILRELEGFLLELGAGKNTEQVELLELGASGIHVAEYWTVLPPREVLHERLHAAIESAQARLPHRED